MRLTGHQRRMTYAMATNPDVVTTVPNTEFIRHDGITQDVDDTVRLVFMLHKPRSMPGLLARMDLQSGYYLSVPAAQIMWEKYGEGENHGSPSHSYETGEEYPF